MLRAKILQLPFTFKPQAFNKINAWLIFRDTYCLYTLQLLFSDKSFKTCFYRAIRLYFMPIKEKRQQCPCFSFIPFLQNDAGASNGNVFHYQRIGRAAFFVSMAPSLDVAVLQPVFIHQHIRSNDLLSMFRFIV